MVWPLTFLGVASRLRDVSIGALVTHGLATAKLQPTSRFPLTLKDLSVERFHHKARAGQIWTAMSAVRLAARYANRQATRLGLPPIPVPLILNAPECRCYSGCSSRVDSSAHLLECINSRPLHDLRSALQNALLPARVPEQAAARLGFHPTAAQHVLNGYIPRIWETILGSGCNSESLHTRVRSAYRNFVSNMYDNEDPVVQERRETCQSLRQPDVTALCAQRYLSVVDGGMGQAPPDPAPTDTPHVWAVVVQQGLPHSWIAVDQPVNRQTLLSLSHSGNPIRQTPSFHPLPTVSSAPLALALALHGTSLGAAWAEAGTCVSEHPRVEIRALYVALISASDQPWEHCPAGTYPLFPTAIDLERLIPAAEAESQSPPDPQQLNRHRHNRVRPGDYLFGHRQGCYNCGGIDHFQNQCPH